MSAPTSPDLPALLQDRACAGLVARWTGDDLLDGGLCRATPRGAATHLFGSTRTTRPVVRGLARSLLGPPGQQPGRNAALFATTLLLALDRTAADDQRLAADDLAVVLDLSAAPATLARRNVLDQRVRDVIGTLVVGWPRRRRRELAVEIIGDRRARTDEFLRRVRQLRGVPDQVLPAPPSDLGRLLHHLRLFTPREDATEQPPPADLGGFRDRPRIELDDGFEVRIPTTRPQLVAEGARFANCLATRWTAISEQHHVIATVHRGQHPVAAAELNPAGDIDELLGPANRRLGRREHRHIEQLLVKARVLAEIVPDRPRGPAEEVAARIACRTALLLAHESEPEPDPWIAADDDPGDLMLRRLGARATLLSDREMSQLRHAAGNAPSESEARQGWQAIGAMLCASRVDDPEVAILDGGPTFRLAVTGIARRILDRTFELDDVGPDAHLAWFVDDPAVPDAVREGILEVLGLWGLLRVDRAR